MKKLLAAMALVLLLSGCQKTPAPAAPEEPASQPEETVQTVPEETEEAPSAVEIPVEIVPSLNGEGADFTLDRVEQLEGQVEDSVGYILDCPVFSGFDAAETVNQFYTDLAGHLENYTKETVYAETMERFTVTDVLGRFQSARAQDGELVVEYTLSILFHDTEEEIVKSRTDYFDMSTGEVRSEEN